MSIKIKTHKQKKDGQVVWYANMTKWVDGKEVHTHLNKDQLQAIGLPSSLTVEEAKARIKQINAQEKITRTTEKKAAIMARLQSEKDLKIAFLPQSIIEEFQDKILAPKFLGTTKMDHHHKTMVKWRAAIRTMAKVNLDPSDWYDQPFAFYNYFISMKFSTGYVERIISFLNLYGFFYCKKFGKPFLPIPKLSGKLRVKQLTAYHSKSKRGVKSDPLLPEKLEAIKGNLSVAQYNWMFISLWFGLRPSEVDACKIKDTDFSFRVTEEQNISVLHIYQPKLVGLEESERWKMIPIIYPEQKVALEMLFSGDFKRPLTKTIQKYLSPRTTTYAGRKGFTDLMLSKGQILEDISQWLGHMSIERTWKNYKNKKAVRFKKAS